MNCKHVRGSLSAYLDRELSGDEMIAIRKHLDECRCCREEAESYRSLKCLLGGLPTPEPSGTFEERLVQSVVYGRTATTPKSVWVRSSWVFAATAACSTLLTLAVLARLETNTASAEREKRNEVVWQIQRDQMTASGSDGLGAPVISAGFGIR
jgi:anti-sigma factor RsiW